MSPRIPWNKGKTKESDKRIAKYSIKLKERTVTKETRDKLSRSLSGREPWNKGKVGVYSNLAIKKMSLSKKGTHPKTEFKKGDNKGEKSYQWKGEFAKYGSLHSWVVRELGKPKFCCVCGKENKPLRGGRSSVHWANKDHKYKRSLDDWIPLCGKCHKENDKSIKK